MVKDIEHSSVAARGYDGILQWSEFYKDGNFVGKVVREVVLVQVSVAQRHRM